MEAFSFQTKNELTFRELEASACAGKTGLLTLNLTRIAGKQSFFFQYRASGGIYLEKGAGDGVAGSTGLAGGTATRNVYQNIVFANVVGEN